jgi:hypothetical protein
MAHCPRLVISSFLVNAIYAFRADAELSDIGAPRVVIFPFVQLCNRRDQAAFAAFAPLD